MHSLRLLALVFNLPQRGHLGRHREVMKANSWEGIQSIFPSEFQAALANNYPPRPGALQTVRAFRENPAFFSNASKKRIEDLEEQIKALQGEKEKLADEGSARTVVAEACATVCAPARRLSRDILHEIAHHALAMYPSTSKWRAPVNLSHVSSSWRSVVLQAPHLWTDLYLRIQTLDCNSLFKYVQAVETWFSRAGTLLINLHLYVDCEIDSNPDLVHDFHLFLKAIAPWTPRVARLGIGGQNWTNLMAQFAKIEWGLPNLRTLEFLGQQTGDEDLTDIIDLDSVVEQITIFRSAKQLTTLIANQEITSYFSAFSFIPWHTLSNVVLLERLSSPSALRKLLAVGCANLLSASLCCFGMGHPFHPPPTPVLVDALKHLKLEIPTYNWNELPRFFSMFVFRSLTHLEVLIDSDQILDVDTDTMVQPVGAMASFPSLTVFRLDSGFPIPYVIDLLRNMRQLRTFILNFSGSSTDFSTLFDAMVIDDSQSDILPRLEEYSVQRHGPMILLDVSTLTRFIRSRTHDPPSHCANLKKLSLTGNFAFLTDLHKAVARISDATKSALEINILPTFAPYHDSLRRVELPHSYFANTNEYSITYAHLVHHDWLLS